MTTPETTTTTTTVAPIIDATQLASLGQRSEQLAKVMRTGIRAGAGQGKYASPPGKYA